MERITRLVFGLILALVFAGCGEDKKKTKEEPSAVKKEASADQKDGGRKGGSSSKGTASSRADDEEDEDSEEEEAEDEGEDEDEGLTKPSQASLAPQDPCAKPGAASDPACVPVQCEVSLDLLFAQLGLEDKERGAGKKLPAKVTCSLVLNKTVHVCAAILVSGHGLRGAQHGGHGKVTWSCLLLVHTSRTAALGAAPAAPQEDEKEREDKNAPANAPAALAAGLTDVAFDDTNVKTMCKQPAGFPRLAVADGVRQVQHYFGCGQTPEEKD